jgi:general secretion pathway protein A
MTDPQDSATRIDGSAVQQAHFGEGAEPAQTAEQMFLEHYGLSAQPFGVTPDPRFLYLGLKHRQALAALTYATESNRGFLTLIAKPGMGKTSLLFHYLESLRNKARTAFLFQTEGDSRDLMCYLLADLGLDSASKSLPEMHMLLNQVLMEEMRAGRRFILVIDEAQNLAEKVLESVRLLSNCETPWMKLMQIVLAGQPQLAERLAKPSMAQLRQRISFAIRIDPFTCEEVAAYVDHRLGVAGYRGSLPFSVGALALVAERSEGIPRNINNMCFCAMSLGWATKRKSIDREMVIDVLADLNLESTKGKTEIAPMSLNQPVYRVVQQIRPAVPVLKSPPHHIWLPKAGIASVALFALGWSGAHLGMGKRRALSSQAILPAGKDSPVPTRVPLTSGSSPIITPNITSTIKQTEKPSPDKNSGSPQPGPNDSLLSSSETN